MVSGGVDEDRLEWMRPLTIGTMSPSSRVSCVNMWNQLAATQSACPLLGHINCAKHSLRMVSKARPLVTGQQLGASLAYCWSNPHCEARAASPKAASPYRTRTCDRWVNSRLLRQSRVRRRSPYLCDRATENPASGPTSGCQLTTMAESFGIAGNVTKLGV